MNLYEKLLQEKLPIQSASETGEIIGIAGIEMNLEQDALFVDICREHFNPTLHTNILDERANTKALKENYLTAITRLEQIQKATNVTNAQTVAAIKDIALIQERILKLLKKIFSE